jgi:UDP-N-acetylmuramoylalanine--D-glutamate ligase
LNKAGIKASYCGNIGNTFTDAFFDEKPDIYVLELSSFQIELLKKFKTNHVCITNIAPDHLDRYSSYNDYVKSKFKIINHLNTHGRIIYNKDNEFKNFIKGDFHKIEVDENLKYFPNLDGKILKFEKFYANIDKFELFGLHNIVNLSFALILSDYFCNFNGEITNLISDLEGLEHRCEFVKEINGVIFINDSKGTNVYSTLSALKGMDEGINLILGGKDKEGKFEILIDEINDKVKAIFLFGKSKEKIYEQLKGKVKVRIYKLETLQQVMDEVVKSAKQNEKVLFSPACASFDQFSNFEERGRKFKELVNELKVTYV